MSVFYRTVGDQTEPTGRWHVTPHSAMDAGRRLAQSCQKAVTIHHWRNGALWVINPDGSWRLPLRGAR